MPTVPGAVERKTGLTRTASLLIAASLPLVALAFWPFYLSRPFAGIDRYTHLHAAVGAAWLALLIAQPAAMHARRVALHRALGKLSYVVAVAFAVASMLLSHYRLASMDEATVVAQGFNHYLPFYAVTAFVLAYALGVRFRRIRAVHARFMLCTAIPLIDPVLGRVMAFYLPPLPSPWLYQGVTFAIGTLLAGWLVFSYRGAPAPRRALIGYFTVLVTLEVGWFTLAPTGLWLDIVRWFHALPLT